MTSVKLINHSSSTADWNKYSNFSRYNKDENIEYHKKVFHDGSVTKIVCWILNTENKLLRVSHPSRDKFYGISED